MRRKQEDPTETSASHPSPTPLDRRTFLGWVGAGAAAVVAGGAAAGEVTRAETLGDEPADAWGPDDAGDKATGDDARERRKRSRQIRRDMADLAFHRPLPRIEANREEHDYPYLASFSKGLPHDALGEVDPQAFRALLDALKSGKKQDFESIPLGGDRPLRNPMCGMAFDLEGPDCGHVAIRPAPRIDGAENSAEAGELYWMALARDVHFSDYATDPLIARAAAEMSGFSDFRGPKESGAVTPATLFRGNTPGDLAGPVLSQFLLWDVPYGSLTVSQRQKTVLPGIDTLTGYAAWLANEDGVSPGIGNAFDPVRRYIRNGRDLAAYVQVDALYEAYLNAALILLAMGAPFDPGNPYLASTRMDGFGTFGGPHILSLVTEVATRALKAVWRQKWFVHRRLRPEAFGGRVHNHITGAASYPIDREILESQAVQEVFARYGTYLLPQAYPEGAPLHPAYGSGHATVAGACVTILKAWFDEDFVLPPAVVASADGTALVADGGPDANALTVGGELNKVAANIASGRDFAGIHWRSDFSEAFFLGEEVAIGILEEQKATYNEDGSFTLTRFDGTTITI